MSRKLIAALLMLAMFAGMLNGLAEEVPGEPSSTPAMVSIEKEEIEAKRTSVEELKTDESTNKQTEVCDAEDQINESETAITEAPTAEVKETAAPEVTAAPTAAPETEAPTAEPAEKPTEVPKADPETTAEPEKTQQPPQKEPLKVDFALNVRYGYVDKKPIVASLSVSGGDGSYSAEYQINRGGHYLCTVNAGDLSDGFDKLEYMPTYRGYYKITAHVTDASGQTVSKSVQIRAAQKDRDSDEMWIGLAEAVELTGNWGVDLLNLAKSQLGNMESETDFIIDENGRRGYTIYGASIDGDYRDWCAAFIKWCSGYMALEYEDFPTANRSKDWKARLEKIDAYMAAETEYEPRPGDLIFFSSEGNVKSPNHIGIVDCVADGMVFTIEGNAEASVMSKSYALDDETIIGYGDVGFLQKRWEEAQEKERQEIVRAAQEAARRQKQNRIAVIEVQ